MNFELRPPDAAGALRIGAGLTETQNVLRGLGDLSELCRLGTSSGSGWGVHRPSGLGIEVGFDDADRVEDITFVCERTPGPDSVTLDGVDVLTMPAADVLARLRRRFTVLVVEDDEISGEFAVPDLMLRFYRWTWSFAEVRSFDGVRLVRPGIPYGWTTA